MEYRFGLAVQREVSTEVTHTIQDEDGQGSKTVLKKVLGTNTVMIIIDKIIY